MKVWIPKVQYRRWCLETNTAIWRAVDIRDNDTAREMYMRWKHRESFYLHEVENEDVDFLFAVTRQYKHGC